MFFDNTIYKTYIYFLRKKHVFKWFNKLFMLFNYIISNKKFSLSFFPLISGISNGFLSFSLLPSHSDILPCGNRCTAAFMLYRKKDSVTFSLQQNLKSKLFWVESYILFVLVVVNVKRSINVFHPFFDFRLPSVWNGRLWLFFDRFLLRCFHLVFVSFYWIFCTFYSVFL